MALTLTRVDEPEFTGNDPRHTYETWKASGATAVNDTATASVKMFNPVGAWIEGGAFITSSVSGQTVTVKSLVALGASDVAYFRIYSRAGSGM